MPATPAAWVRGRLGCLMFLQYFLMGSWFVPFGSYMSKGLRFDGVIGIAYGSQGIATIVSVLFVGSLADRFFRAERLLAVLFLLSAATLWAISLITTQVELFLVLVLLHFLVFIPTIPLANSLCFRWLPDPAMVFPRVRAVGTIGWIASGLVVGSIAGAAATSLPLRIAAGTGLIAALYVLTLPASPPEESVRPDRGGHWFGFRPIATQADRSFWILIGATMLVMVPMAFYYAFCNNFLVEAGVAVSVGGERFEAAAIQSLGQVSELVFLLFLPPLFRRFGIKGVFLAGIASWVLRCALFAAGYVAGESVMWMILAGVLLHGAANDFIQVAGQIHVDRSFTKENRVRAQALFTTVLMGIGTIIGSLIANVVYSGATISSSQHDWPRIWMVPAIAAAVTFMWFLAVFPRARISARS